MDIKHVLKDRRAFASSFQKYIKMILDDNHPLFNSDIKDSYYEVNNHFENFHNQIFLLKDHFISIESQIQDINNTLKQFSSSNINTNELQSAKDNLLKRKIIIQDKIKKNTLKNYHYSLSLLEKYESKLFNILTNETNYPDDLKNNQKQLEKGFPLLLDFCYKWEADNLFISSKINSECRSMLNQLQKSIKNVNKLKLSPQPFFDTREYKNLSESLPIISKAIDNFTNDTDIWTFLEQQAVDYPKILGFINIFDKKDFKSVRSKIRIFSHLDKTEELLKIIKSEFRSLEQIFSVYFYQLDAQKKEILNICLPINEYKKYILKQWMKKEFAVQFNQLKSIEEEYGKQIFKF